jgi:F-type H+-transporting ATPase subunit b
LIDFKPSLRSFTLLILSVGLLAGVLPARPAHAVTLTILAAGDQPTLVSGQPAKGETKAEKKSEEEETNAYRHSATVQWFAKTFHLDVEVAAQLFEWINFTVIILAVGIPLIKVLPKVLRKRTETLSHELQAAQAATESANARLSAVEEKLSGLDAEISAIRKQVEEDMREDEVRIKASIEEESARIVTAAEHEIGVAAMQAQRGLKQYAADLAIDRAMGQLTLNADTDRALIAEFARDSRSGGKTRKSAAGGQD